MFIACLSSVLKIIVNKIQFLSKNIKYFKFIEMEIELSFNSDAYVSLRKWAVATLKHGVELVNSPEAGEAGVQVIYGHWLNTHHQQVGTHTMDSAV